MMFTIFLQPVEWWAGSLLFWTVSVVLFPHKTSDIHAISIVILSLVSLNELIPEAPRHVLSMAYFIATGVQMIVRKDWIKVVHHLISILAGTLGLLELDGYLLDYRLSSRVLLIEFSTPLLHWYKASGSKKIAACFAVSFIALRTFWLGFVVYQLLIDERMSTTICTKLLAAQWLLNQYWTFQIIQKFTSKPKVTTAREGGKKSK